MKKKIAALVAVAMIFGCAVGGTLAWLMAETNTVTNTFTTSDVSIDLKEHVYDPEKNELTTAVTTENSNYKMVPGNVLPKDPEVTVKAPSEECYLFVEIEEANRNVDGKTYKYYDYEVDTTVWTPLAGETGVYYLVAPAVAEGTADANLPKYPVLKNNQVTVSTSITKADMEAAKSAKPTLKFTAYAVQKANVADEATAWSYVENEFKTPTQP